MQRRQPIWLKVHAGWLLLVEDANAVCLTAHKLPSTYKGGIGAAKDGVSHSMLTDQAVSVDKRHYSAKTVQSSMDEDAAV